MLYDGSEVKLFKVLTCTCGHSERVRVSRDEFEKLQLSLKHFDSSQAVVIINLKRCDSCNNIKERIEC